jgi:hypothetical protein
VPDLTQLSRAQLETRLSDRSLSAEERDALVEELSSRIADELLVDRAVPSPSDASNPAPRFEPPPVRTARPTAAPDPAPRIPQPRTEAPERAAARESPQRRKGFSRSLAALVALAVVAGGAWGTITLLDTAADGAGDLGGQGTTDGGGSNVDDPGPAAVGPSGTVRVAWVLSGVPYVAVLETDGSTGVAEVTYFDSGVGAEVTIRQGLRFEAGGGSYQYTGHDPIDPATGAPAAYAPDTFFLERDSDGWYFSQVCDTLNQCAAADSTAL